MIGGDINPVSTFLVQQALTRVNENDLRTTFAQLEKKVANEIQRYYQTRDPETNELIQVLYYFWVKIAITVDGESIPLFSNYVFSKNAYPKKKPNAQIICPKCWDIIEDRFDATQIICPHCQNKFNPQQGAAKGQYITSQSGNRYKIKDLIQAQNTPPEHYMYAMLALRSSGKKIYLPIKDEDRALFQDAAKRLNSEDLPLPTMAVRSGHNTDQARGYNYRYSFFQSNDSSHSGEVQHKEPKIFAQQLSRVFSECYRVLEKDGLLIFSFHHSQPDGWTAIYEAIRTSDFKVIAAHPVYAEMKVASPKTSGKEPISLDAIIVCRKDEKSLKSYADVISVKNTVEKLEKMIESSGIKLSKSDKFIILASQLLVRVFNKSMSFEDMDFLLQQHSITPNKPVAAE